MKKRVWVYAGLLVGALAALAATAVQVHGLEGELQRIADDKIAGFRAEEPEDLLARLKIGASVVATKRYVLFGDVSGKVRVFLQHDDRHEKSIIEGFEFFLRSG